MRTAIISERSFSFLPAIITPAIWGSLILISCGGGSHHQAQDRPVRAPLREVIGSDRDPAGQMEVVTLPEGFTIPVRIADEINSKHAHTGEMYSGSVDPSVLINDVVVIPRGTEAHIRMNHVKKGGHIHGKAEVALELVGLIINGRRLEVDSNEPTKKKGSADAKADAITKKAPSAGGTLAGAPVGVAMPVIAAFSAAKVEVKPGSRIEFKLESAFTFRKPPISSTQQLQIEP